MDDPLRVRVREAARHLRHDLHRAQRIDPRSLEHHVQRLAVEQLHDEKRHAAIRIHVEDRDDVLVIELCGGQRFAAQHRDELVDRQTAVLQDELDRHRAIEMPIDRAEHVAHAARAELLDNLEAIGVADPFPRHRRIAHGVAARRNRVARPRQAGRRVGRRRSRQRLGVPDPAVAALFRTCHVASDAPR
jgi:hypothetical protein